MNVIIFPLLFSNPPLNIPVYKHELDCYTHYKQLQGQCNFKNMVVSSSDIYSYGVVGIKDKKVCTSAMILLPKNGIHYEIYSLCTSLLSRRKGCASEMMISILNNLSPFYKYAWIGVDAHLDEKLFKSLIKFYLQLGFTYYVSYNKKTPLGIPNEGGFIQLVKKYISNVPTTFTNFFNSYILNLAWTSARTKTTTIIVRINPTLIHNLFRAYGRLPYEVGGLFVYNRLFPTITNTNSYNIEIQELTSANTIRKGDEEFLTVMVPPGLYNFHTHPVVGTNLFKTTFAWPSVADILVTLGGTFYRNLLLHVVISCDAFYTIQVTRDAIFALRDQSNDTIIYVLENIKKYLDTIEWEQHRNLFYRYFNYIGWTTRVVQINKQGEKLQLTHEYISPTKQVYSTLGEAMQSPEYKQLGISVSDVKKFINRDVAIQLKFLKNIVGNLTLDKFIPGSPKKAIIDIQSVPYTRKEPLDIQVSTFELYDIPIFSSYPQLSVKLE